MTAPEPLDMTSAGAGATGLAIDPSKAKAPLTGGFNFILLIIVAIALAISFGPAEMYKSSLLVTDADKMGTYLSGFLRPDFGQWELYMTEIIITVQIALWGTFLAVVAAIPFGLLASRNVAPVWIVQPVRRLMDLFRSINELVIATIFIVAVGLGPFAGVMALAVHTTGVLAKLFSEAVEAIEPGPVEGVRATGASRVQEVVWGVIPQVLPLWTSFALYRFESNARSSTVLGIIGAGGIGALLMQNIRSFNYERTAAIVILMVIAVIIIDNLSQAIRKRLV
ncbi:phosphonate ABC transporter, permease protein PhnE [Sphingoaurantiacus capsulatus]|uniref:Phosphonate ABC transporter, permease protein PhnE n=1 Tax=Sphingoaurantiacus capsulatus TaxID=1771310 RepID=A0ABV7X8G9_9SPHN